MSQVSKNGVRMWRLRLKCDGTRAETRFRLSAKRKNTFKSAGVSVQSTTGSRGERISGSNAGYTMFRGSVKGTGYSLHSSVSPSFPHRASPCAITFQLDSTNKSAWIYDLRKQNGSSNLGCTHSTPHITSRNTLLFWKYKYQLRWNLVSSLNRMAVGFISQ